jgi:hypothetical protein
VSLMIAGIVLVMGRDRRHPGVDTRYNKRPPLTGDRR